jgi:tetratricopeptide (TPR) repeat protein
MFTRLISLLCISSSLLGTYTQEFEESFTTLRKNDWARVIELGHKALEEGSDPKIHARLASSYFYLGNYQAMKKHIDLCLEESLDADSEGILIRALYLLSAYHRGQKSFGEARAVSLKALSKARQIDNNYLIIKSLFNAGAAEQDDPAGNHEQAKEYLEEAISLSNPHDIMTHRILIRLGRAYLGTNCLQGSVAIVEKLSKETLSPRNTVHFRILAARVAHTKQDKSEVTKQLDLALQEAHTLKMEKDIERIEALKQSFLP